MSRASAYGRIVLNYIKKVVNPGTDIDTDGAAESIRANIHFRGVNVYILAFAIAIASLGLNVNSIPVIIGAMLISPLMGPILGLGLGLGTSDMKLVRDAFQNFVVMVIISIVVSTLYFLLTPLDMVNPTELLARTNPTIYDVLIALFGGFAGIWETARVKKGTVLSGVAIATALMPPLCTVGYGLAQGNLQYVGGALYLFLINSVFIALATYIVVRQLNFKSGYAADPEKKAKARRTAGVILVLIIVPSILSAVSIVRESNFARNVDRLLSDHKHIGKAYVYEHKLNTSAKPATVDLYIAGETPSSEDLLDLYEDAKRYGLFHDQIIIHDDAATAALDESELIKGIYERNDRNLAELKDSLSRLNAQIRGLRNKELPVENLSREIFAQYPGVQEVSISRGRSAAPADSLRREETVYVQIKADPVLDEEESLRLESWLRLRIGAGHVRISQF